MFFARYSCLHATRPFFVLKKIKAVKIIINKLDKLLSRHRLIC